GRSVCRALINRSGRFRVHDRTVHTEPERVDSGWDCDCGIYRSLLDL
ncbi:uncharacterized protein METZ01_LOCUS262160, partial [marine metagenome]